MKIINHKYSKNQNGKPFILLWVLLDISPYDKLQLFLKACISRFVLFAIDFNANITICPTAI